VKYILFDIDGTLISTGGAGVRALNYAFKDEFPIDNAFSGLSLAGKTDLQIIKLALQRYEIPFSDEILSRLIGNYLSHLRVEINNNGRHLKPGVMDLLEKLRLRDDIRLGLLTGNLEPGARIKLNVFGLNEYFPTGAFGSDSEDRNRLLPFAVQRYRRLYNEDIGYKECIIVGDTPRDIFCAKPYGARSIAIATGPYPKDALRMAEPDLLLDDMSDIEAFLDFIQRL